jgi:putative 4-mercaptohistidine N1-methyltranferase
VSTGGLYESQKLLGEYLLLHYGSEDLVLHPSLPVDRAITALPFPVRCVRELLDDTLLPAHAVALEVGCSVGAAAFELARFCARVEASDYSASFINAASMLRNEGRLESFRSIEGNLTHPFVATVPAEIDRSRVFFAVADATDLPAELSSFDVVLAANLICRLPDPEKFLSRTASLVKPGGQLLLTTPFTWLEEYTPRNRWIGGIDPAHRSEEELTRRLSGEFRLHRRVDLPFLIREHERKYQLGIALGTSWVRR